MTERYKDAICIEESSHIIVVEQLNREISKLENEIENVKAIIHKSSDELNERLHMLKADREINLNELLNLRLRQENEKVLQEKIEAATLDGHHDTAPF